MSDFLKNTAVNLKKRLGKLKATGEFHINLSNRFGILEKEPDADSGGGNSNNPKGNQIIDSDYAEKSGLGEGKMNFLGEKRAKEVRELLNREKDPLVKNILFKMLKKISREECTLNQWLSNREGSVVSSIEEVIGIIGGIVGEFCILHLEKKTAHGKVTSDNVHISGREVKLVNSSDCCGNKQRYKEDFLSLKKIWRDILGERQNPPEDLLHFFDLIDGLSEGPSFDWNWVFVYNHPVFWPINGRINFRQNIRSDYWSERGSQFGEEFRVAVCSLDVTGDWVSKAKEISPYNEILRGGDVTGPIREKYLKKNEAMSFLIFCRDSLKHAGKYAPARTQEMTERDLHILSPRFLPCLVQRSLHLKPVRDAAPYP